MTLAPGLHVCASLCRYEPGFWLDEALHRLRWKWENETVDSLKEVYKAQWLQAVKKITCHILLVHPSQFACAIPARSHSAHARLLNNAAVVCVEGCNSSDLHKDIFWSPENGSRLLYSRCAAGSCHNSQLRAGAPESEVEQSACEHETRWQSDSRCHSRFWILCAKTLR